MNQNAEVFMTDVYDEGGTSAVIRPAAIVPEDAARAILVDLSLNDVRHDGLWLASPAMWVRFDRPWLSQIEPGASKQMGTVHVAYGTPTRYDITIYRVVITTAGAAVGWTVESLTDAALAPGGLSLASCPRAVLHDPPKPFSF